MDCLDWLVISCWRGNYFSDANYLDFLFGQKTIKVFIRAAWHFFSGENFFKTLLGQIKTP